MNDEYKPKGCATRQLTRVMTMRTTVLVVLLSVASVLGSAQEYFPKRTFSTDPSADRGWARRYSKYLRAMKEPSLSKDKREQSYRFLWLRTSQSPISVRIDVKNDGTAILTTKVLSGAGGHAPGHLVLKRTMRLTSEQTSSFLRQVDGVKFWALCSHDESVFGPDGAQWVIEGTKSGQYHIVDRWTPSKGPVRTLGLSLAIDLAGLHIPDKEIY